MLPCLNELITSKHISASTILFAIRQTTAILLKSGNGVQLLLSSVDSPNLNAYTTYREIAAQENREFKIVYSTITPNHA